MYAGPLFDFRLKLMQALSKWMQGKSGRGEYIGGLKMLFDDQINTYVDLNVI